MKKDDLVKLGCGVARVVSCTSTFYRGVETWSIVAAFSDRKTFAWGCFRRRNGVWFRFNPFEV